MDEDNRFIIECKSRRINEDIVEHLRTPCLVEVGPQGAYDHI